MKAPVFGGPNHGKIMGPDGSSDMMVCYHWSPARGRYKTFYSLAKDEKTGDFFWRYEPPWWERARAFEASK